ncbi:hypothetical protein MOE90_21030 [Bacillus spizizenii]|nr:hypothetical protein [Bacillus spizizenii]MCY9125004.1 hypothetical protein [Bacillus spizizenii]
MKIEDIFMASHGSLSTESLIPIEDAYNYDFLVNKLNLPDDLDEVLNYLEIDADELFVDPTNFLNPIIYLSGFVYIDVTVLDIEFLKMLRVKERIEQMNKLMDSFIEKGDWERIFSFTEKKLLIIKFLESYREIPKDQIIDVFADIWTRSESGFELIDDKIFEYVYSAKEFSDGYRERMNDLRDRVGASSHVTVYRGDQEGSEGGYDWSLSYQTAKWFANRFDKDGVVYEGRVHVKDILDYFTNRGESEVLIDPKNVFSVSIRG